VHETAASGWRIQEVVAVVDLPCSGEQGIDRYSGTRLIAEVDDLVRERDLAGLGYPDGTG
jgi:hypothetical protein